MQLTGRMKQGEKRNLFGWLLYHVALAWVVVTDPISFVKHTHPVPGGCER